MTQDVTEVAAAALVESWQHLEAAIPDGWTRADSGDVAMVTGVAMPTLNGVWVASQGASAADASDRSCRSAATCNELESASRPLGRPTTERPPFSSCTA